jgi:hypothetical protein
MSGERYMGDSSGFMAGYSVMTTFSPLTIV